MGFRVRLRVWGLRFRVQGLGFRVRLRVWGLGFRLGLGFGVRLRVWGLGLGFGFRGLVFGVRALGLALA